MQLIEAGIAEGDASSLFWAPPGSWRRTKDGKGWYSQIRGGTVVSVKQARTQS